MKNRWALAFAVACGLAWVLGAWLRAQGRDVPLQVHVALTLFLVGMYVGLVSLSLESPNAGAGRSGSHRRTNRPDLVMPWWLQTVLAGLLAVVVALLWRADAHAMAAVVGTGLVLGATAHWWVALILIDVVETLRRPRP